MDKRMMELIENERVAQNQLENALTPDTIQDALRVLQTARETVEAYRIYKKKEYNYNLAVKEKDRNLKILNDMQKILENT
jgi:hypothetical protein